MKIVITGGPCSGKTALVDKLFEKGYEIIPEVAREIIEKKHYSKYLDRYPGEALNLQLDIYDMQIEREKQIDDYNDAQEMSLKNGLEKIIFLDRGYIDNQAYCKHLLGYIPEKIKKSETKRYDAVFVLEHIPFEDDGLRRENESEAIKLQNDMISTYRDNGYNPILVPVYFTSKEENIDARIKSILKTVNQLYSDKQIVDKRIMYKTYKPVLESVEV